MLNCPRCDLNHDFIPGKEWVDDPVDLRPPDGFYRCCVQTSNDIQSGPIYCGDRATLVADQRDRPGLTTAVCKRHERRLRDLAERKEWDRRREQETAQKQEAEGLLWDGH